MQHILSMPALPIYILTGFVAPSDFTRSSYDWQYFYINNRMVKDKLIQHAMRQAFGETLYPGRYAAYVLYLTLNPTHVDVNVHPTKHEVRFHNTRLVHDFVVKSVQDVLQEPIENNIKNTRLISEVLPTNSVQIPKRKSGEFLTLLNNQLIISQTTTGLGLLDIHAYYAYQAQLFLGQQPIARQPLFPAPTFKTTQKQQDWIYVHLEAMKNLGFIVDAIGECYFVLREIPAVLSRADMAQVWAILSTLSPEDWLEQLACAATPQEGLALSRTEIEHLLDTIEILPTKARCPHGLKIWQIWSLDEMRNI